MCFWFTTSRGDSTADFEVIAFKNRAEFAEMFDDQIGMGSAQLLDAVVAGQNGAGEHAAVLGGFDIVLHVAYEKGFVCVKLIFLEHVQNFGALVPDADVRAVNVGVESRGGGLGGIMIWMDGAKNERAQAMGAAESEEVARVRQFQNRMLPPADVAVKGALQLIERNLRSESTVKTLERQAEFGAELIERHRRDAVLLEDEISRRKDGRQIVHQRSRPVKNNIANRHGPMLFCRPAYCFCKAESMRRRRAASICMICRAKCGVWPMRKRNRRVSMGTSSQSVAAMAVALRG